MIADQAISEVSDEMMQQYFSKQLNLIPNKNRPIIINITLKFILILIKGSDVLRQDITSFRKNKKTW